MRTFESLAEAASELKRDLSKAPLQHSSSVQGMPTNAEAQELLGYTYTIQGGIPAHSEDIATLALDYKLVDKKEIVEWERWLQMEAQARTYWNPGVITENSHPKLKKIIGPDVDYSYSDRLSGSGPFWQNLFEGNEDTRRGYWPFYQREDALRSTRNTRIPCTIGYQAYIRKSGNKRFLHLVYLQRSCDFQNFWISDVWLARVLQHNIVDSIRDIMGLPEVEIGQFTHFIISLHAFLKEDEIY